MTRQIDCNILVLQLKETKKNYRMDICREHFEIMQNGALIIDELFKTIRYFPESISDHDVQARMKSNSFRTFSSMRQCLRHLDQRKRNVVLAGDICVYVTTNVDGWIHIFEGFVNKYGRTYVFEYNAVQNCMKEKAKSKNGVKDVSSKHTERSQGTTSCDNTKRESRKTKTSTQHKINFLMPRKNQKEDLGIKRYYPDLPQTEDWSFCPIFRTKNEIPSMLMSIVNSKQDPFSLCAEDSSLGEIVTDCAGPDSTPISSTPQPQTSDQTFTRQYFVLNARVSNDNSTEIRRLEEASSSESILPSAHGAQVQTGNRQRSPKHPRYNTYDPRIASFATFREFRNLDTEELARTGLFYTGKAYEVQCFQCGTELRNWRPDKDPLAEHIKTSPDCPFLEEILGVHTLNQYKVQIRSSGKISGREYFSSSSNNGGVIGGTSVPVFIASDHIRSPQYEAYIARLPTFERWPPSMTQKPEQVAQAGFYYTGLNDVVRCFACDGGLKNWDPEDEPWIEHARWFPQCPFVQKVKGQEFIDLVRRMTEESDEEEDVVVHSNFQRNNPMANTPNSQHLNVGNGIDEPSQLDKEAAQNVIQTGYSRSAVAIAIDVLISKGKSDYTALDIMEVILEKEDRGESLPTDSDLKLPIIPSIASESDTEHDASDTENILRKNKSLKSIITCIKCKAQARNTLFLPCSHHCLCQVCAEKCSLCPVCYKVIKQKIKTFMI